MKIQLTLGAAALLALLAPSAFAQQAGLDAARYTDQGELLWPAGTDRWIMLGASLGSEYSEEPFDPENPGTIGVVQMEPSAYEHFLEHGEYADGSMFLLTFYQASAESEPQLPGFVQGAVQAREIHVIDRSRFADGRGFFLYRAEPQASSAVLPPGNECVQCHEEHGRYDGTFTQFYPAVRGGLTPLSR